MDAMGMALAVRLLLTALTETSLSEWRPRNILKTFDRFDSCSIQNVRRQRPDHVGGVVHLLLFAWHRPGASAQTPTEGELEKARLDPREPPAAANGR
jgi:hypothetical protein